MGLKVGCFIGFLYSPEENFPIHVQKVTLMNKFVNKYKICYKRTGSKPGCLAGVWHHCVMTVSLCMHAYRYLFLKVNQNRLVNNCSM